jgi:hypothetical protein
MKKGTFPNLPVPAEKKFRSSLMPIFSAVVHPKIDVKKP